ncbi:bacteriocin class II family protein [Streptococcus mutans]|uniref:bacteriocin class II family protein n=3 Tax=Streptococcus mutans TaxID=1309 RepID=UPI00031A46D2|nr:bacteriocin class II family protein [Streptococcus mutans]MCB4965671.1 bacteriocin class II family protein [Streptococcus mutans]MCB4968790.1 bacteriocin class II family protein [Streptococcus mutans]MCB5019120.1 bacteriocin class II family protein [Streptococcus mutans]MCB5081238.1 bacteriocin class II family protein [Streptococcus mutans]MDT9497035.1 bacteriocin class II family protein [Streptococcus mutans]
MNTQAFEQFNVMDNEVLSTVEGGGMIRCALGTAGSAGLGFVGGMGAGTVTLPVVGTVSGAALGGWSGAAVGAATFC